MLNSTRKSALLSLLLIAAIKSMLITTGVAQDGSLGRIRSGVRGHQETDNSSDRESKRKKGEGANQHSNSRDNSKGKVQQVRHSVRQNHSQQDDSHQDHSDRSRRNRRGGHGGRHYNQHNDWQNGLSLHFGRRSNYHPVASHCHETVVVCNEPNYFCEDPGYEHAVYLNQPSNRDSPVFNSPVQETRVVESTDEWFRFDDFANWAARGSMTIGADFDDLSQANLALLFQDPGGIGLDLSVTTLREQGFSQSLLSFRDNLWIGDVNLVFEPICNSDVRLRCGAGLNWLADSYGSEAGFNLTAGIDLKLTDRLILSGEGDIGTLGDADFWHGRVHLARQIGTNAEWLVGIDHYNIGGTNLHNVFTGIGFRF